MSEGYTKARVCFECKQENPLVNCKGCNLSEEPREGEEENNGGRDE